MIIDLKKLKESGACLKMVSGKSIGEILAEAEKVGASEILHIIPKGIKMEAIVSIPPKAKVEKPKPAISKPSKEELNK